MRCSSFTSDAPPSYYMGDTESGTQVLTRQDTDPAWTHHSIDETGVATSATATGFEGGIGGGAMWPLPDGSLFALGQDDGGMHELRLRPSTRSVEIESETVRSGTSRR